MSIEEQIPYAFSLRIARPFAEVLAGLRQAIAAESLQLLYSLDFGIPDKAVQVLGVADSHLTHKAFRAEPSIGLLLPLQIVLRADADQKGSALAFVDPVTVLALANNPEVTLAAWEMRRLLEQVRDRVAAAFPPATEPTQAVPKA